MENCSVKTSTEMTTDTALAKINLEEQIEHQKRVCEVRKDCVDTLNITIPDVQEAILATLQSLKNAGEIPYGN